MSRNFDLLRIAEHVHDKYHQASETNSWSSAPQERHDHRPIVDDEVMKLVQRLFILPDGAQAPDAIAFCGVEKGVGCSWVCANAAQMLAAQGLGTVCVIDANFNSPSLHHHFRVGNRAGFAESLKCNDSVSSTKGSARFRSEPLVDDGRPHRERTVKPWTITRSHR